MLRIVIKKVLQTVVKHQHNLFNYCQSRVRSNATKNALGFIKHTNILSKYDQPSQNAYRLPLAGS